MKSATVATAALFGLASYLMLELFFGSYGVISYRQRTSFLGDANADVTAVREHQEVLQREIRLLTTDPERVVLEARDIGLVDENDTVVRITGWEPRWEHRAQTGALPAPAPQMQDHRPLFRSISTALALVVLLVDTFSHTMIGSIRHRRRDDEWDVELDQSPFSARHSR